uniref:Uncharacterized protein n=1 Tax=Physcomitrium patens TaxID=3218 RepID=A0A2K1IZ64_PHYPA|nr:hypothetical protein PHYPA_024382 [Physcomitrium patens]
MTQSTQSGEIKMRRSVGRLDSPWLRRRSHGSDEGMGSCRACFTTPCSRLICL